MLLFNSGQSVVQVAAHVSDHILSLLCPQVRIEDECVTPEDIQCAVHLALFASDRARSKRLRQDDKQ